MNTTTVSRKTKQVALALVLTMSTRILLTLYWVIRYSGRWIEDDSARMAISIRSIASSGRLIDTSSRVYSNGFLYQVYTVFASLISGLDLLYLQVWVYPIVGVLTTFCAFIFYIKIFETPILAGFSAVLLSLQADFLFITSRGTHEKFTFILLIVAILAMLLAVSNFTLLRTRIALAILYYLMMFALSSTNVFFSSTLIFTLIISFFGWRILSGSATQNRQHPEWLLYIASISLIFIVLVIFYVYPPALGIVLTARDITSRIALFLISQDMPAGVVFQTANSAWRLPQAWLLLRIFDLFLIVTAAVGWLLLIVPAIRQKAPTPTLLSAGYFWIVLLFPAFMIQNSIALISDITGGQGTINNLQVRLFPLTTLLAVPLSVYALQRLSIRFKPSKQRRQIFTVGFVGVMIIFAVMSLIKSTSEPLLSNTWLFYTANERRGIMWLDQNILILDFNYGRRSPRVWAGPDFRLGEVWLSQLWERRNRVPLVSSMNEPFNYVLLSPTVKLSAERYHVPLPNIQTSVRIYDNGDAKIYLNPLGRK